MLGVGAEGGTVGVPKVGRGTAVGGVAWAWGEMQASCGVLARVLAGVEAREVRAGRGAPARALCGMLAGAGVRAEGRWRGVGYRPSP